ncbi:hypothetical protein RRG08_011436 [Elysia crispata]|uniref:Uncharacterized protein n=1 Tax=Elysia crispata TaxID=231223 RepID=A0AAE0ZWD1_9GAST|nr:hypothetical protein RRG08_011436 [Elysia crispata]
MPSPDLTFLKDFPSGPLDQYRKDASFGWKKMAIFMEGEKLLRYKYTIFKTLEKDSVFSRGFETPVLEKQRELAFLRARRFKSYNFLPDEEVQVYPEKVRVHREALGMYDWALGFIVNINQEMFGSTVMKNGTRHMDIVKANRDNEVV